MPSTFVQFRVDDTLKAEATLICKKLGIDLQTYMRMCLARLVSNNGIPFDMVLTEEKTSKGIQALLEMNSISSDCGNSDMTLEDINKEIHEMKK